MNSPVDRPPGASVRLRLREIDRQVAARVRTRRIVLGLTMQQLATLVGVTYQQLYKYESGTNRIAAGRLHAIAQALDVAPSYFFEDSTESHPDEVTPERRQLLQLLRDFVAMPSCRHQEALCGLARVIAAPDAPSGARRPTGTGKSGLRKRQSPAPADPDPEERLISSPAA